MYKKRSLGGIETEQNFYDDQFKRNKKVEGDTKCQKIMGRLDVDWFPSSSRWQIVFEEPKEDLNSRLRIAVCYLSNSLKKTMRTDKWQTCVLNLAEFNVGVPQKMIESSLTSKWSLKKVLNEPSINHFDSLKKPRCSKSLNFCPKLDFWQIFHFLNFFRIFNQKLKDVITYFLLSFNNWILVPKIWILIQKWTFQILKELFFD